jgi:hypothetical protein
VNYLAVLVAAVAYFVLGALWHAPPVFGRVWQRATGVQMAEGERPSPALFIANIVAYFVTGIAIAALAVATGTDTAAEGLVLGVFVAVGFALPTTGVIALYERKPDPGAYFIINGVYNALGAIIMAVIIGVWT